MEKYEIITNEFFSTKKLTQKEIENEKNYNPMDEEIAFTKRTKEEAEKTLKSLIQYEEIDQGYDDYYEEYAYKRFKLIKVTINEDDPNKSKFEILGLFYPNYEKEDEENE